MWRPKSARNASEPVSWGRVVGRAEGRRALYHSHRESAATRSAPGQREISWAGFRPSRRRRGSMPARTHPDIAGRGARVRPLRYASRVEPSYPRWRRGPRGAAPRFRTVEPEPCRAIRTPLPRSLVASRWPPASPSSRRRGEVDFATAREPTRRRARYRRALALFAFVATTLFGTP